MATYKQKSEIHGIGLFTYEKIKEGDVIMEVADLNRFYKNMEFITNKGKLVNHKKDCNCYINLVIDKYYLLANRDIEPNEELTADYSVLEYPFKSDVTGYKN
jgi:SET domain-containing protein